MARKNARLRESYIPLDVTPPVLDATPSRLSSQGRTQRDAFKAEDNWQRARRQDAARANSAVDWSVCVVPGCGRSLIMSEKHPPQRRDTTLEIPICFDHAAVVWKQLVAFSSTRPEFIEAVADVNERLADRTANVHEARKVANLANVTAGDIYFIRIGELVKVGWTRDVAQRLKSYGASAELLACYPASRDDETNLHRQLTPARAKGREWYEDGAIIATFINEALAKYGMPKSFEHLWTQPKAVVAGKRAMRYR